MSRTSIEFRAGDGSLSYVTIPVPAHAVPSVTTNLPSGASFRPTGKPCAAPLHSRIFDEIEAAGVLITQGPVPNVPAPDPEIAAQLLAGFEREAGVVSGPGPFAKHPKDPRRPEARAVADLSRKWLCGLSRDERFAAARKHVPANVYDDTELRALVVASEARGYQFANVERERAEAARAKLEQVRARDRERAAIAALDAHEEREVTPESIGQVCVKVDASVSCGVHPSHPLSAILLNARRLDLPDGGRIVFFNRKSLRHGEVEVDRGIRILASDAPIQMTSAEWAKISRVINSSWPPHIASLIDFDRRHDATLFFGPVAERPPADEAEREFRLAAATAYAKERAAELQGTPRFPGVPWVNRSRILVHDVVTGFALDPIDATEMLLRLGHSWISKHPDRVEVERGIATDCSQSAAGEIQDMGSVSVGELLPKVAWTPEDGTDLVLSCLRGAVAGRDSISFSEAKQAVIASGLIEATSWSNVASRTLTEKLRELGLERAIVEDENGQRRRSYVRGAARSEDEIEDAPAPAAPAPPPAPAANPQISTWRLRMSGSNRPERASAPTATMGSVEGAVLNGEAGVLYEVG